MPLIETFVAARKGLYLGDDGLPNSERRSP
jgi:hypothetical protein